MADGSIVSRDTIFARGAADFRAGKSRDSHELNWHALALPVWLAGYDEAAQFHCALPASKRVDVAQECPQ